MGTEAPYLLLEKGPGRPEGLGELLQVGEGEGYGRGSLGQQRPPMSSHYTAGYQVGAWHWLPQQLDHLETGLGP